MFILYYISIKIIILLKYFLKFCSYLIDSLLSLPTQKYQALHISTIFKKFKKSTPQP